MCIRDSYDDVFLGEEFEAQTTLRGGGNGVSDLIWLDPDTGEDLVLFPDEELEAAFDAVFGDFAIENQEQLRTIWFSPDGVTWTEVQAPIPTGDDGFTAVAAVGDDEIVLRSESSEAPPTEFDDIAWTVIPVGQPRTPASLSGVLRSV